MFRKPLLTIALATASLVLLPNGGVSLAAAQSAAAGTHSPMKIATGSGIVTLPSPKGPFFDITAYGAAPGGKALQNQAAINAAIDAAAKAGGGTVVIPHGTFKTYSVRLKSNVGLHFTATDSVLQAAIPGTGEHEDGGFYDAPEKNLYVGIQDEGHSHWANSLIYGINVSNVMISGPGLIDGSTIDGTGLTINVLPRNEPREVTVRTAAGVPGGANKAIGLENSTNIIFRDFRLKNGGHFAILGTAVNRWTIDGLIVDTNRDAIDIDTSQNVTVRNSVVNSLTDDAIVLKGSFGAGRYLTSTNILIENDTVSGYDAGSVLDKVYSVQKRIAADRDGPTGRVKFGTEGTSGLDTVTIRHILFDHSRGFALESVDGAELKNILFTDIHMKHVSSSPIFIDLADRGRAPVTGTSAKDDVSPTNNVRLNDTSWILPDSPAYTKYPPKRYLPSYDKSHPVSIEGGTHPFTIVNPDAPTRLNPNSIHPDDPNYANAEGPGFAKIRNIVIRNVVVEDADPRYPILLSGLVGHPIQDVSIDHISVTYRGGLSLNEAVYQRQINDMYTYSQYKSAPVTQAIPWLVNTFFAKNEALLPRIDWDPSANGGPGAWKADPYNVPEMPREYPEPSILGILPAYGIYARHVQGLRLNAIQMRFEVEDKRPAVVLDDVTTAHITGLAAPTAPGVATVVEVRNTRKRESEREYVKNTPYLTTDVTGVSVIPSVKIEHVTVDRPSPGTPPDDLYTYPTAPTPEHPYRYAIADDKYPRPLTVYRPIFDSILNRSIAVGDELKFTVKATSLSADAKLAYSAAGLPTGASFDPATRIFTWTPTAQQAGAHTVTFTVNDGVLPESNEVTLTVLPRTNP